VGCARVNTFQFSRMCNVLTQENPHMSTDTQDNRGYGFAVGLLTGTFVGAGLMMWLAPRTASEVRQRMADSAKGLGKRAADGYQQASARVAETVDELARTGPPVRDDVADTVARGARKVERYATAAKSEASPL
jgi:gas vesicle protein